MDLNLDIRQEKYWKMLQFFARLACLSVPLYIIIAFAVDLSALQLIVAGNSAWLLSALGSQVTQQGALVQVGDFSFLITPDCTAWKSFLFLFGLLFAVPAVLLRRRLIGLAIGIPVLWLTNLLRIVSAAYSSQAWGLEAGQLLHDFWWELGMTATVLAVWVAWLQLSGAHLKPILTLKNKNKP